ncbi:MAG: hypothetical protein ACE5K0_03990 [Candidatus Methanofastidiosia archaeon]
MKKPIYGLFDFYGNKYAYHRVLWVEHLTATGTVFITRVYYEDNLLDRSQFPGKNLCELFLKSVSEWEKAGGRREGEWLKEFEKSEQYTEYVDEILKQLENPNGKNLEETYNGILNLQKPEGIDLSLMDFFLYDYILKYYKDYAKLAYERYSEYVEEGDFYSAVVYSYFIYYLQYCWLIRQELDWWEIHRLNYTMGWMYDSNIYIDFLSIFLSSLLIGFIGTMIISKRYLRNDGNDIPKNKSKGQV